MYRRLLISRVVLVTEDDNLDKDLCWLKNIIGPNGVINDRTDSTDNSIDQNTPNSDPYFFEESLIDHDDTQDDDIPERGISTNTLDFPLSDLVQEANTGSSSEDNLTLGIPLSGINLATADISSIDFIETMFDVYRMARSKYGMNMNNEFILYSVPISNRYGADTAEPESSDTTYNTAPGSAVTNNDATFSSTTIVRDDTNETNQLTSDTDVDDGVYHEPETLTPTCQIHVHISCNVWFKVITNNDCIDLSNENLTKIRLSEQLYKYLCFRSSGKSFQALIDAESLVSIKKFLLGRHEYIPFGSKCSVCMDNTCNITILNCGHRTLCRPCADNIKTCPICRSNANTFLWRTFEDDVNDTAQPADLISPSITTAHNPNEYATNSSIGVIV